MKMSILLASAFMPVFLRSRARYEIARARFHVKFRMFACENVILAGNFTDNSFVVEQRHLPISEFAPTSLDSAEALQEDDSRMAKRVLITDDALFMRVTLKNILTKGGYEIVGEAANGQESVDMYQQHKPDLVTMDITMPEMDGITAVREIKKLDPNANVIMCTAMGQKSMVMEAVAAGAKDFLVKPFQPDKVIEAIQKIIG